MIICKICGRKFELNHAKGNMGCVCNSCRQKYRQKALKEKAIEYKGGKCQKCGYNKCDGALEFHHRDPSQKKFIISRNLNISWKKLKVELDKCDLLCANCHREIHTTNTTPLSEYRKYIHSANDECATPIKKTNKHKTQIEASIAKRKVKRPETYEEFQEEFNKLNQNFCAIGRKYGVSDNSIRKWIKTYKKYNK